jgi:hypothetical protein
MILPPTPESARLTHGGIALAIATLRDPLLSFPKSPAGYEEASFCCQTGTGRRRGIGQHQVMAV